MPQEPENTHSQGWYAQWHNNPYSTYAHFAVLIVTAVSVGMFSVYTANSVPNGSELVAAPSVATKVKSQVSNPRNDTAELLSLAKQLGKVSESERDAKLSALTTLAKQRSQSLAALAEKDPYAFLLEAVPEELVVRMPESIRGLMETAVDIEGELTVLHADPLIDSGISEKTFYEVAPTSDAGKKRYRMHFAGTVPDGLDTGAKVKVKGVSIDDELVAGLNADGTSDVTVVAAAETESVAPTSKAAIILVNFTNNTSQPWSQALIAEKVLTGSTATSLFYQENSFDKVVMDGDVLGWYTIPYTNSSCTSMYSTWGNAADTVAQKAGVDLTKYQHKIYIFNSRASDCPYGGYGQYGGTPTKAWIFGYNDPALISHEVGHNLGARHAQWLKCGSKAIDVYSNCTTDEYGDRSDVMGVAWGYYHQWNPARKVVKTWLDASKHMQTVTTNGTYTVSAGELDDAGIRVIKIPKPDTNEAYYLTFRSAIGFDTNVPSAFRNGAAIHIWSGYITGSTKLIDTTPGDGSMLNAPLANGRSFTDPSNGITITQQSFTPTSVTFSVAFTGAVCTPTQPTLTVSPISQSGIAGEKKSYSVSIKNNDTATCGSSTFALSATAPTGWSTAVTNGSLTITPGSSASTQVVVTSPQSALDGTYQFTLATAGSAQNHTRSTAGSYVVYTPLPDGDAPTVKISSPKSNSTIKGNKNLSISTNASDASGVASIDIRIDGASVRVCSNTTTCSYSWSQKLISSGQHTIEAVAKDMSILGNTATTSITIIK